MKTIRLRTLLMPSFILTMLGGCAADPETFDPNDEVALQSSDNALSASLRRSRAETIRDVARAAGIETGFLIAGIAEAESGFVQCGSEKASWMCSGPQSPECGGPVMAGGSDGSCSNQQGGLGMFQLDAGNYAQTLSTYGQRVLSVAGNTEAGIDVVIAKMAASPYIQGVLTREKAIAWLNDVRIDNDRIDPWIKMLANGYNGCQPGWDCWGPRLADYRAALNRVWNEMGGADFWFGGSAGTCSEQETANAAAYGCQCVDHHPAGGFCEGSGCTAQEEQNCAAFGAQCVDHNCNGGFADGHGCTALEEKNCAAFGAQCVDHKCSGGFADGHGCTAREEKNCAAFGTQCVDHLCSGGFGDGHGCTALEEKNCAAFGTQCVDHLCSGGFGEGNGCTAKEQNDCNAAGQDCRDHNCTAR